MIQLKFQQNKTPTRTIKRVALLNKIGSRKEDFLIDFVIWQKQLFKTNIHGNSSILMISGLRLSVNVCVCMFLMDAQTFWPIVSKLDIVIEVNLAGNISLVSYPQVHGGLRERRKKGGGVIAALSSAHRMHSACAKTKYLEDGHCRSSISPQNALYPGQGWGWGGG